MSTVNTEIEHVMVVPTQLFHQCGYFQGFNSQVADFLPTLLDPINTSYLPRDEMESDPNYKQLIPYCIFKHTDSKGNVSVFQYTRGKKQGEQRLHSKRSVGIGGHVSTLDGGDHSPYEDGLNRELQEEVVIGSSFQQYCVGLINDDENEVGQVHLGIVHVFEMDSPDVAANETEICDAGFRPVAELMNQLEDFETWSQICLNALFH